MGGGRCSPPPPPHTRKHNARIINVEQTLIFEASLRDLKSGGVGGGAAPPICKHNPRTMAFDTRVCVEASLCDLKKEAKKHKAKSRGEPGSQEAKKPRSQEAVKPRVRTRGFRASKCVSCEWVVNRALKTYQNSSFGVSRRVSCERVVDRGLIFF